MPVNKKVDDVRIVGTDKFGHPTRVIANARLVLSNNVEYIAWPTTGEPLMIVKYKNGGVYGYLGVSRQRAVAAAHAPSVGSYIAKRIKGHYKPVKIEGL